MKNKDFLFFAAILVVISLIQVSFISIPFGIAVLFWRYLRYGMSDLIPLLLIYTISLAIISTYPLWLVFFTSSFVLFLFIFGRSVLPEGKWVTAGLFIFGIALWELGTYWMILLTKI